MIKLALFLVGLKFSKCNQGMLLGVPIIQNHAHFGPELLTIIFSSELSGKRLTYWTKLYHVSNNIPSEYFLLWPMHFRVWHFGSFLPLSQFHSLLQHIGQRHQLTQSVAYFMQLKDPTHLKLNDSECSGENYWFHRDSEFLDYILITKALQL